MLTRTGRTGEGSVSAGPPLRLDVAGGSLTCATAAVDVTLEEGLAAYRQRDHQLVRIPPGTHDARLGDGFLIASRGIADAGADVFDTSAGHALGELLVRDGARRGLWQLGDATFRTDSLDELLARRLGGVSAAAVVFGLLHPMEAESIDVSALSRELLEAGAASSPEGHIMMIVRAVDEGGAVTEAAREIHHVACLAPHMGARGMGLGAAVATYGSTMPRFLRGLERIGATEHASIVRAAITMLAPEHPRLSAVMTELALAPAPPEASPESLVARWQAAPSVTGLAAHHVSHSIEDFVTR